MTTEGVTVMVGAGKDEEESVTEFLKDLVRRLEAGEDVTVVVCGRVPGTGGTGVRMIGTIENVAKAIAALGEGLKDITKIRRES